MQEQIIRLSCENADLRNDLKHNEEQHSQVEYTTESFNSKNLAGETTSKVCNNKRDFLHTIPGENMEFRICSFLIILIKLSEFQQSTQFNLNIQQ